jgi:GST-like protein
MSKITLYGRRGWGSAIVEAQLEWLGIDYTYEAVGDLLRSAEARSSLAPVNPLAQVPTLVLPNGQILTESAAITLYLADMTGRDELVPPPGSVERPDFLCWLIFLVANVYRTYTYADEPNRFVPDAAARDGFRATVDGYAQRLYGILAVTARTPWFLGECFSALDIYVAVMTRWRPGRRWFAENAHNFMRSRRGRTRSRSCKPSGRAISPRSRRKFRLPVYPSATRSPRRRGRGSMAARRGRARWRL